jgi:hypothetical protein
MNRLCPIRLRNRLLKLFLPIWEDGILKTLRFKKKLLLSCLEIHIEKNDSEGTAFISIVMSPRRSLCNSLPSNDWMSVRIPFCPISVETIAYGFARFTPSDFGVVIKKGGRWVTFRVYPVFHQSNLGSTQRFLLQ